MRRMRPELTSIVRQVRTTALWALACSVGAAVCALTLPLAIVHALDSGMNTPPHMVLQSLALTFVALALRGAFLTARSRMLSRAALWTTHALGTDVLADGLDAIRTPNDIEADRERIIRMTNALPRLGVMFDAALLVLPLCLLMVLYPIIGLVTLVCLTAGTAIAAVLSKRVARHAHEARVAYLAADGAWRTAAASSIVIAARGMTGGVVGEWQSLHSRGLAHAYRAVQARESASALLRHLQSASILAVLATLAVFNPGGLATGVVAAAIVLHMTIITSAIAALDPLIELTAAQSELDALYGRLTPGVMDVDDGSAQARVPRSTFQPGSRHLAEAS